MRLSKAVREFNVSTETIIQYLRNEGEEINGNPNTKLTPTQVDILKKGFKKVAEEKKEAVKPPDTSPQKQREKQETPTDDPTTPPSAEETKSPSTTQPHFRILGNIPVTTKKADDQFTPVTSSDAVKRLNLNRSILTRTCTEY